MSDDETRLDCYRQASVCIHAYLHEGFGLSVAGAMLAGCIPVVTRAGALPEVVGDAGIYLSSNVPKAIAEGVQTGLQTGKRGRRQARERILQAFPLAKRKQELLGLVDSLITNPG